MSVWLSNFMGLPVNDSELETVMDPEFELGIHVTLKTIQAGTVAGAGIVGPIYAASIPGCTFQRVLRYSGKAGKIGALVGLITGPVLCHRSIRNEHLEVVKDMCYRLRNHQPQLRVDRTSTLSAGCGYVLGRVLRYSLSTCTVLGFVGGIFLAEVYNMNMKEKDTLWLEDAKSNGH